MADEKKSRKERRAEQFGHSSEFRKDHQPTLNLAGIRGIQYDVDDGRVEEAECRRNDRINNMFLVSKEELNQLRATHRSYRPLDSEWDFAH